MNFIRCQEQTLPGSLRVAKSAAPIWGYKSYIAWARKPPTLVVGSVKLNMPGSGSIKFYFVNRYLTVT